MNTLFNQEYGPKSGDERLNKLSGLIESVDRPGDYCVHDRLMTLMPKLEVGNSGILSFPIPPEQIRSLIAEAEPAPYGKGEETILDASVRDCWQVASDKVRLGKSWKKILNGIVRSAASGLGCPEKATSAELYKLLIYEKGGFFKPHRDTEKTDGMVATLVIALPTAGAGGDLAVRHQGNETVIDMCANEPSELAFAAFYADCEHEVFPVTEGHRICLVYNLILKGNKSLMAPNFDETESAIATELTARSQDPDGPNRFVWVMDHDYSEAGLSFDTLKNIDAAVGRVLAAVAHRSNFELFAAILRYEDSGPAISDYGGYGYWDQEAFECDDFEIVEVSSYDCWLEGWVRPDNKEIDLGKLNLEPQELMPEGRMKDEEPDSSRLTEATGNAGASFDRSYSRAAFILWPKKECLKAFKGTNPELILNILSLAREQTDSPVQIKDLASQLMDIWPNPSEYWEYTRDWPKHTNSALSQLCEMEGAEVISSFLDRMVLPHYTKHFNQGITKAAKKLGAERVRDILNELILTKFQWEPEGIIELTSRLLKRYEKPADGPWPEALQEAVTAVCDALPTLGNQPEDQEETGTWSQNPKRVTSLSADALKLFFFLGWHFGLAGKLNQAVKFIIGSPNLISPDRVIPQFLNALWLERRDDAKCSDAFDVLWRHSSDYLLSRSATYPESPPDWKLPTDQLSSECPQYKKIKEFCADPQAQVLRLAIAQSVRFRVMSEVEKSKIDMRFETEEKGRPYKLVCTKTRASYERRLKEYSEDIKHIRLLKEIAVAVADSAQVANKLSVAIAHSD